ncbi:MAG: tripartite tricarboxylate transporter TctB family protein [Proteobacteria bacterium]|nr:tripartite tricarboxylate transporter TctB family protein [Pseudomonadota bacterium]
MRISLFAEQLKKRDFYAGGLIVLIGVAVALNAYTNYNLGSLTQMGPGMFPFMLGIALTFVGLLILGAALVTMRDPSETILPEQREWRGWACILAGPVLFIILGEFFGMAAATFGCVFVSALGDRTATLRGSAILGVIVTVFGCLLFSYVLKLPFPIFKWAF